MAAIKKQIVCLANSKKLGGRCVAGVEITSDGRGDWIRPVSTVHGGEVPLPVRLAGDEDLELLDIIEVTLLGHHPDACHVENWLYDQTTPWTKIDTFDPGDLGELVDEPSDIFGTGSGWSNSVVLAPESESLGASLVLIEANQASIVVKTWPQGDTSVAIDFYYAGTNYEFKLTDPSQKRRYIKKGVGHHALSSPVYVCASLTELQVNKRTKLAAAVFTGQGPA